MSFIEAAKDTIEMHANQLRYAAGSIACFRTEDSRKAKELLNRASYALSLETQNYHDDELQSYIQRARAYLNEMEGLIRDDDWTEVIHHAGHVEQEMSELMEEIKSNANNN